jgi:DNA helicase-2/ATP-dependent DNA helicase PcrA
MVDEYQDANIAQFRLLELLAGKDSYICVVGDDDQSIYRFRGAEVKNILSFQEHFANTKIIRLEQNYRSFAPILSAAQSVVQNNSARLGKTLRSTRGSGEQNILYFLPTQEAEAAQCADIIQRAAKKNGTPYSDWAILYRTNAQSLSFESEFLRKKIPYKIVGSLKFYEREEIKDALALLSLSANPRDEIAFRRIVNKPARGVGLVTQEKIIAAAKIAAQGAVNGADDAASLIAACVQVQLSKKAEEGIAGFINTFEKAQSLFSGAGKLSVFVEHMVTLSGLVDYHASQDEISGTQRTANLQELINSASLFALSREGLLEFLDHIELDRTLELQAEKNSDDAVTLITLHNTKGLEFSQVIITGLENGIFPRRDKTGEDLEEERRLFYVGITRARDRLFLTSCAERRLFGKTERMEPSQFLQEIDRSLLTIKGINPLEHTGRPASATTGSYTSTQTSAAPRTTHPLEAQWPVGTPVFNDDYGYGKIIAAAVKEGEFVITVHFETSGVKTFLPEYQQHALTPVKTR